MPMKTLARTALICLVLVSALAGRLPAQPPEIVVSPESLLNGLNDADKARLREVLSWWLRELRATEDPERVVALRTELLKQAMKYPSGTYQSAFAQEAAQVLGAIFRDRPTTLRQHKEVNLAMVFAELPTVAARHAYDQMAFHPNGGVRYLAWRGYRRIRTDILAEGGEPATKLYGLLEKAAQSENSPIVAEELFAAMTPPTLTTTPMPAAGLEQMRTRLLGILQTCWRHWCETVLRGDAEALSACQAGLGALRTTAAVFGENAEARKAVLQSLADMVWCASKTYFDAEAAGPVGEMNAALLLEVEAVLRPLSGLAIKSLSDRLVEPALEGKDLARMVRVAALEWIEALKQSHGIDDPKDRFAAAPPAAGGAATTAPSS